MARIDVHQGEWQPRRVEGLLGEAYKDDGVLTARKKQGGPLVNGGNLTEQENGLGFQLLDMG
jgi:hypothetical protein